jgi:hypothetical protein
MAPSQISSENYMVLTDGQGAIMSVVEQLCRPA